MTQEASSPRRKKPLSPTFDTMEEDKGAIAGLNLRSAPIDKLASTCMDCFDEHGSLVEQTAFPRVLFLMHKWFMTSEELGKQFKLLYPFFFFKIINLTHCILEPHSPCANAYGLYKTCNLVPTLWEAKPVKILFTLYANSHVYYACS
nr:uncharacterized protein LOC129265771 [Lytechinus pictus]